MEQEWRKNRRCLRSLVASDMVCPYPILGSLENVLYTHPKITLVGVEDMIYFVGLNSPQQTI